MKRRLIALILAGACIQSFGASLYASLPEIAVPCYDNIDRINHTLSFNGSTGKVIGDVLGGIGTTKIRIILTVYKETDDGWEYVDHDSITVYDTDAMLTLEFDAEYGTNYKSVLSTTVTANGTSESELDEIYESYP